MCYFNSLLDNRLIVICLLVKKWQRVVVSSKAWCLYDRKDCSTMITATLAIVKNSRFPDDCSACRNRTCKGKLSIGMDLHPYLNLKACLQEDCS